MALVNQKVTSISNPNPRQGNANPVLYALAAQAGARCDSSSPITITNTACVFYDVTKGNNSVACIPNLAPSSCSSSSAGIPGVMIDPTSPSTEAFSSTAGYDLATGLGTVNAFNLANNWNSVTFTPSSATLTLNGSASALTITHGASVTFAGAVTPGTATGNVSLLSDASVASGIDGATLTTGAYSKATKLLPGGTYNVHAHYTGDGVVAASDSATVHVTVSPEASIGNLDFVTFSAQGQPNFALSSGTAVYGAKSLLHLLVRNSTNSFCDPNPEGEVQCATGTVSVTDNGTALAAAQSLPLNSFGEVDTPVTVFTGGVHNLQSTYSGDANYASNIQTNTVTITKAATSTVSVAGSPTIAQGASETLTANISSQSTTVANASQEPNGTVQFLVNGTAFGSPVTVTPGATLGLASGTAQLITTTLPAGTDNVTATYSGDGNYTTSTSTAVVVTVTGGAPDMTVVVANANPIHQADPAATYQITVTNSGGAATTAAVSVVGNASTGQTFVSLSGTGWTCTNATQTCTRSDVLAAAASYPVITMTVSVSNTATGNVSGVATVSGGGETNTANDAGQDLTTVAASADIAVIPTHVGSFAQGQTGAVYSLAVQNGGGASTSGTVTVVDTLPPSLTATAISGTGWTCVLATLTCSRGDVLTSGSFYPTITLTVNVSATAPTNVINSVTVSGGGEFNTSNDTSLDSTSITVASLADLTVTKSHTGTFLVGGTGTYTVTVNNIGAGPTIGTATVTDTLPTGLTLTAISGTGWTCSPTPTPNCTRSDALANGSSYPAVTVTVNIAANAPASVTNSASVGGGGETNTANDSASDITAITQAPDLTIAKTHTGNFTQGQVGAAYTIIVTNSGLGSTAGTVTVADTLPAGLTATAISGTGWTCTLGTLTCTRADVLATTASYPAITVTVNVANNAPASVTNTAVVSGGGEVVTTNDTATNPTTITQLADMTVTKSHIGSFVQGQTGATYTITASNIGAGASAGTVTVVDTLPTGLTATAMAGTGWTCPVGTLTCTRADALAPATSYPAITLTVTVAANAAASVTNSATVSGGGELIVTNDSASDIRPFSLRPPLRFPSTLWPSRIKA